MLASSEGGIGDSVFSDPDSIPGDSLCGERRHESGKEGNRADAA